jgi:acyl-CoA synthetase (AMP-forming)/AMP-acid ligase II
VNAAGALDVLRDAGVLVGDRLHLPTSGTTARPRKVVRTVDSWVDSFDPFTAATGLGPDDDVLVPSPPHSTLFLYGLAHAAHLGAAVTTMDRWSAREAATAAKRCTAGHFTPPMLAALLPRLPDGHRLRTAILAGATVDAGLRRDAERAGVRVVDYYGAAELSFVTIRGDDGVMRPFPRVDVELRDGVVWARSPWLSEGYAVGQAGPLRRDGEWATVGDLGHWGRDGGLVVDGRGDGAITVGGATVLPSDVAAVLAGVEGVREVAVVGLPSHDLGQVVGAVVVADSVVSVEDLRTRAAAGLAATHRPVRYALVDELPLAPSGKVDTAAARAILTEHAGGPTTDPAASVVAQ